MCKLLIGSDLRTASWGPSARSPSRRKTGKPWPTTGITTPTPASRQMEVLWLKSHGLTHDQIAAYADVSQFRPTRPRSVPSSSGRASPSTPSRCGALLHAVAEGLAESLGIELLYLPSYSPNLNLIERLWRFVRVESLDSTSSGILRFTAAIDPCLDELPTVHKGEMGTLLTHEFQTFEDVPLLAV